MYVLSPLGIHTVKYVCILSFAVADFRVDFKQYLENLENSPLTDLQGLIDFNIKHSDEELPPGMSFQIIWSKTNQPPIKAIRVSKYWLMLWI